MVTKRIRVRMTEELAARLDAADRGEAIPDVGEMVRQFLEDQLDLLEGHGRPAAHWRAETLLLRGALHRIEDVARMQRYLAEIIDEEREAREVTR